MRFVNFNERKYEIELKKKNKKNKYKQNCSIPFQTPQLSQPCQMFILKEPSLSGYPSAAR